MRFKRKKFQIKFRRKIIQRPLHRYENAERRKDDINKTSLSDHNVLEAEFRDMQIPLTMTTVIVLEGNLIA
jgi:hypothetical protein